MYAITRIFPATTPRVMPGWVSKVERVIEHIAIAIQRLRIGRPRHNGIRTEETTQLRIIPPGIIVTQPLATRQAAFVVLAGEAFGGQIAECPAAVAAVGVVIVVGQRVAALIYKATTRLRVVLQQVEDTVSATCRCVGR
jgi:hypothetical protein